MENETERRNHIRLLCACTDSVKPYHAHAHTHRARERRLKDVKMLNIKTKQFIFNKKTKEDLFLFSFLLLL